jgi:hypothetical protein
MTGGVSIALSSDGPARIPDLAFPQFLGTMGRTRFLRATRLSVVGKVGNGLHLSKRKAVDAYLPFLERLFKGGRGAEAGPGVLAVRRAVARELHLSAEELAFLLGSEVEAAAVRSLVASDEAPVEEGTSDAPGPGAAAPDDAPKAPPTRGKAGKADRRKVQRRLVEF